MLDHCIEDCSGGGRGRDVVRAFAPDADLQAERIAMREALCRAAVLEIAHDDPRRLGQIARLPRAVASINKGL